MQTLFILFQRLLPQHLLSRLVGALAKSELAMIKGFFIRAFCLFYNVNRQEAKRTSIEEYR